MMKMFSRSLSRDRRGASTVEFAFVTPALLLALGCVADIGAAVRAKFVLSAALANASSYALNNLSSVSSSGGAALAATLATILASSNAANWANASVTVNNGPRATLNAGVAATGGAASNADLCYCPTGSKSALSWGAAVSCGATCPGSGAPAGKYVLLTATRSFTPLILPAGLIGAPIAGASVVQVQ